jgi:hypothetical protein
MHPDVVAILVILWVIYNGIRGLIKAGTTLPPGATTNSVPGAPLPPGMQQAQGPLAGHYGSPPQAAPPQTVTLQTDPRTASTAYGNLQPGPDQPQRRSANGGVRRRPRAATQTNPALQSNAPMSDTALQFAQEKYASDLAFAEAAQVRRDETRINFSIQTPVAETPTFLSGRNPLVDAIILSQALGRPVCRNGRPIKRYLGHTIAP